MAKAQLLRYEEWENAGRWHCNDTSDLTSIRCKWWTPARMLNMPLDKYVQMVIEKFKPDYVRFSMEYKMFLFSWKSQAQMRKFKNWINAEARKRNYII